MNAEVIELDVAVVGGGVSGAYSAWRLQQDRGERQQIGLFEYSDRIGGRLYSISMPGMPHVKAEVGGMRYIPDEHLMVAGLVEHLGLPTKDFPMGAPEPTGAQCNLFYLRGKHLRLRELSDPDKLPYNLAWSERGLGPTNLQVQVMNAIYPGMADLSLCQQMGLSVFGKPLWTYGFWDLMYRCLSTEAYHFMKDAGGYDANVANANAVTQLPATEYKDDTRFLTLRDGYDQLPITLVKQFNEQLPGVRPTGERVWMNQRLAEILIDDDPDAAYRYTLVFERTATQGGKTAAASCGTRTEVKARQIILAMPRRSLELIESRFFDDPWLQANIPSVLIQSAFKLFLAYERPWWRSLGLVAGRSVTDLPVRQVYYFGTEGEQPGGEPNLNSLLMASYNDMSTVTFWKSLEDGPAFEGRPPSCLPAGTAATPPEMESRPTQAMVDVASQQLAEVHALPGIEQPYAAVFHDWTNDPYGGGWHEWKANYRLDEIMCRMRKPVDGEDIHIVGSAYSNGQGWVEGALDTAESTLQDFFGLAVPGWLSDPDYRLLPNPCPGCGALGGCVAPADIPETLAAATPSCLCPPQVG